MTAITASTPRQTSREDVYKRQVYEGSIDNIIGVLHMKDFLIEMRKTAYSQMDLRKMIKEPYCVCLLYTSRPSSRWGRQRFPCFWLFCGRLYCWFHWSLYCRTSLGIKCSRYFWQSRWRIYWRQPPLLECLHGSLRRLWQKFKFWPGHFSKMTRSKLKNDPVEIGFTKILQLPDYNFFLCV